MMLNLLEGLEAYVLGAYGDEEAPEEAAEVARAGAADVKRRGLDLYHTL